MEQFIQPGEEQSVIGDPQDNIRRQQAVDPTGTTDVTDEEQAQYDDFVTRAISLISDTRTPPPGKDGKKTKSPSDATIALMNSASMSVPAAIANAAAQTTFLIANAARRAKRPFPPDVLFHGADELIAALYLLGNAERIFKGVPPLKKSAKKAKEDVSKITAGKAPATPEGAPEIEISGDSGMPAPDAATPDAAAPVGAPDGADSTKEQFIEQDQPAAPEAASKPEQEDGDSVIDDYDLSDEEYQILGEAKMLATERFGKLMLDSGQITPEIQKEAKDFWMSQVEKETESGKVGDESFDKIDVGAIRQRMQQQQGAENGEQTA